MVSEREEEGHRRPRSNSREDANKGSNQYANETVKKIEWL